MKFFFSIERTRNFILAVGSVLFFAVAAFLLSGQWKRHFLLQDLPHRLGADIQIQANQFDYTQTRRGKTLFRIHAARAEQTRKSSETMLHDVRIEFFNPQGEHEDTIRGDEFQYNQSAGIAVAQGEVEIAVRNPSQTAHSTDPEKSSIRIRTSGLTFDQKNEVATTSKKLDFILPQGNGTAIGAVYDAAHGQLTLNSAVELHVQQNASPVTIHASHAEMQRAQQTAILRDMRTDYSGGTATSGLAHILFRSDGSIATLEASNGVTLHTNANADGQAPQAVFQFNTKSQPAAGVMSGGTSFQMNSNNRLLSGSAPRTQLHFDANGQLQTALLLDGAVLRDQETAVSAHSTQSRITRNWRSQTAELRFAPSPAGLSHSGANRATQLQQMNGDGRVSINSTELTEGQPPQNSMLAADHVQAFFSATGAIRRILGSGHTKYHEATRTQGQWTSVSDTLDAQIKDSTQSLQPHPANRSTTEVGSKGQIDRSQIERIVQDGHVRIDITQASSQPGKTVSTMHAFAAHSDYDGDTGILHLTGTSGVPPRLLGDNFSLNAQLIDLDRVNENALASHFVQATWTDVDATPGASPRSQPPVHILASEAAMDGHDQQVTFTGTISSSAHLWQDASSITAPKIVLNRTRQTLDAVSVTPDRPVDTVLAQAPQPTGKTAKRNDAFAHVLQFTSGAVHESFGQQLVEFSSGVFSHVTVAATAAGGPAQIFSDSVRVFMHTDQPPRTGTPHNQPPLSAVDRMICTGKVRFSAPGRTGRGEMLEYTSDDSTVTLTGTSTQNPQLTDQLRGIVTGRTIRLHLDDDSISIDHASGVARSAGKQR